MTRKHAIVASLVILLVLLLWLGFRPASYETAGYTSVVDSGSPALAQSSNDAASAPSPAVPHSGVQANQEKRKKTVERILSSLSTSITFYGKVVDQHGQPVADARVGYSAMDKWMQPGTGYSGKSDEQGLFSITGIKGAELGVMVEKEGYYFIDGKSHAAFAYGIGPDSTHLPPPTKDKPAVFVLHKMGETEPLVHVSSRTYRIPRDGTPVTVNLKTGKASASGDVRVETWTNDQAKDAKGHYDWRCRISVPGGGLVEREDHLDFEAPLDGYQGFNEIVMPQTAERWQPQGQRSYFLKLADGQYARIEFKMVAQGHHFFRLESYLNPKPGSRNLEFDPAKAVK